MPALPQQAPSPDLPTAIQSLGGTLNSLAEIQTSSNRPQAAREPLDFAPFGEVLQRHPDGDWRGRATEGAVLPYVLRRLE